MKALIISADNFEDSELLVPYYRLKEAGVEVTVASRRRGANRGEKRTEGAGDCPEFFCPQQTGCSDLSRAADPDQRRSFEGETRHLLHVGGR